ncbi:MAG: hypothetical protein ACO1RX_16605 [Candidatus Sericytochromatia bacterium]
MTTLLAACVTPSPLALNDTVSVTGQLVQAGGQPAANQQVNLDGPLGFTPRQSLSDASGSYRFELQGRDTQFWGAAADLTLRVGGDESPQLEQRFKALKTQLTLPSMRFWNDLQAPQAGATITQLDFTWQGQTPSPTAWELELQSEAGTALWRERVSETTARVPEGVLAPQQRYRWRVAAHFSDYSAWTAPRSVATGNLALATVPIAQISGPGAALAALYDGDYASSAELRGGQTQTLLVRLKETARTSGLYWKGTGFAAEVAVRARVGGPLLGTLRSNNMGVIRWPEQTLEELVLELRSTSTELAATVAEIRVLGPAS